jgi:hypothetical protein
MPASVEESWLLPGCSWAEYCDLKGVQSPEKAQRLLDIMAGMIRASGKAAVPPVYVDLAEREQKDPHVLWLWALEGDYICDNKYILGVMVEYCTPTSTKDLGELAAEMINDRKLYQRAFGSYMQRRFGCLYGGHVEPDFDWEPASLAEPDASTVCGSSEGAVSQMQAQSAAQGGCEPDAGTVCGSSEGAVSQMQDKSGKKD